MSANIRHHIPTILLFEDEPDSISFLQSAIRNSLPAGIQVVTVSSVGRALALRQETQPGLIVANLELPGTFDLLEAVRDAATPVLLTIHDYEESLAAVRFLQWEFLVKPFHVSLVTKKLQECWLKPIDENLFAFELN